MHMLRHVAIQIQQRLIWTKLCIERGEDFFGVTKLKFDEIKLILENYYITCNNDHDLNFSLGLNKKFSNSCNFFSDSVRIAMGIKFRLIYER